ncbi:hypothetical protein ACFLYB_06940 [Chloroflexota bacterium]
MLRIDEIGTGTVTGWTPIGSPYFDKKGKLIISYVDVSNGPDLSTLNLLGNILGLQFAGQ